MKSKTLKIRNIPSGRLVFFRMNVKPTEVLVGILVVAILFLFMDAPFPTIGLIASTVVCFALVATPDRTLLDMNDEFMTFYSPKDSSECTILYWDEILKWQYVKQRQCDHLLRAADQALHRKSGHRPGLPDGPGAGCAGLPAAGR